MLAFVLGLEVPLLEAFVADGAFLGGLVVLLALAHSAHEVFMSLIFGGPLFFFRIASN